MGRWGMSAILSGLLARGAKRMAALPKTYYTPEEYLVAERLAPYKSEYIDGDTYAMAGTSRQHNVITLNVGSEIRAQFRARPCDVYTLDMRAKVSPTGP